LAQDLVGAPPARTATGLRRRGPMAADAERRLWAQIALLREALARSEEAAKLQAAAVQSLETRLCRLEGEVPAAAAVLEAGSLRGWGGTGQSSVGWLEERPLLYNPAPEPIESDSADLSGDDLSTAATDAPENMFTYCVVQLIDPAWRVRARAGAALFVWICFQNILSLCYFDSCRITSLLFSFADRSATYDPACFYQGLNFADHPQHMFEAFWNGVAWRKQMFGVSIPDIVVSVLCLLLLGLYFKRANMDLLLQATIFEQEELAGLWKFLLYFGEVSRTCVVPAALAGGAALQLAQSYTVADTILNSFGVGFLLDLDRLLYDLALSQEQKRNYIQRWGSIVRNLPSQSQRRHRIIPNLVFMLDMSLLVSMFCVPLWRAHHLSPVDAGSEASQSGFYAVTEYAGSGSALGRAVVLCTAMWRGRGAPNSPTGVVVLVFKIAMATPMLVLIYSITHSMWLSSDNLLDFNAIHACESGRNSSACTC